MAIKVKAIQLGFYGNQRRRPGAVFNIKSEEQFSSIWMKKIKSDHDEIEFDEEDHEDHEELEDPELSETGRKRKGGKKKKLKPDPESSDESVI